MEEVLLLTQDARRPVGVRVVHPADAVGPAVRAGQAAAVDEVIGSFGIDRFRRHQIAQLSTGTRRVVDLASIVLARPRLLLLDEPTAGIAQREAEAFVPLLRRLHQLADTTIVLVEHDVPLVFALCTQVVMMETGEVVSSGTPDEVAAGPPGAGRLPRGQRRGAGGVRGGPGTASAAGGPGPDGAGCGRRPERPSRPAAGVRLEAAQRRGMAGP